MTATVSPLLEPLVRPVVRPPAAPDDRLPSLDEILRSLGIAQGITLDFGDERCDPGSGQTIRDLSGNGRNVLLGATSGASTDDPSRVGPPGLRRKGDGRQFGTATFMTIAAGNDTFIDSWHKNDALFTLGCWFYWAGVAANGRIVGTKASGASSIGLFWGPAAGGTVQAVVANGTANQTLLTPSETYRTNAWNFAAMSVDEGGSSYAHYLNGVHEPKSGSYTSPSSSAASLALKLGARGTPDQYLPSGSIMRQFFACPAALTKAQLDAIYNLTRPGFA